MKESLTDSLLFESQQTSFPYRFRTCHLEYPFFFTLGSHSLGSAVVNKINEEQPNKFSNTTYATPTIKPKRKGKQNPKRIDLRNPFNPVSILDSYTITSDFKNVNPLIAHSYMNFEAQGMWHTRPTTHISNGFNPNESLD